VFGYERRISYIYFVVRCRAILNFKNKNVMNNLENTNPAHSHFLKSFLERNVRDVRKTLKTREDELQLALELKIALKKGRQPKDASNEMSIEIYKKSIMKLDFVLDWLDIQLSELENNQLNLKQK
jgi:hypothetical protein